MLRDPELAFQVFLTVIVLAGRFGGWHRPRLTGWVVTMTDAWPVSLLSRTQQEGAGQ
jgi:hypothetical protein